MGPLSHVKELLINPIGCFGGGLGFREALVLKQTLIWVWVKVSHQAMDRRVLL